MRHRTVKLAALAALALAAMAAHAAPPTTELKVTGRIAVPTCTVAAPDAGTYDFGRFSSTLIKSGSTHTALTPIKKTWSVSCDADTFLTFKVIDNRDSSSSYPSDNGAFGLGNVNTTGKIGYYNVLVSNPTVDSVASTFSSSTGTALTGDNYIRKANYTMAWSIGSTALKAGQTFAADFEVRPFLGGSTHMNGPVTEQVALDGSLTLNFAYGL
nr:hypothetical protein [uncultured Ralstonia sp.]